MVRMRGIGNRSRHSALKDDLVGREATGGYDPPASGEISEFQ